MSLPFYELSKMLWVMSWEKGGGGNVLWQKSFVLGLHFYYFLLVKILKTMDFHIDVCVCVCVSFDWLSHMVYVM